MASEAEPGDSEMAEGPGSSSERGPRLAAEGEQAQVKLLVNKDGRYVCMLCHKTFKTGSILKAHMVTHSSRKDHECKLCGASFRTKGSLIRHHRRHTGEPASARCRWPRGLGSWALSPLTPGGVRPGLTPLSPQTSAPISVPSVGRASGSRGH